MTNIAIENGPVEIVSFPINSMVMFNSYVSLPEGNQLEWLHEFSSARAHALMLLE